MAHQHHRIATFQVVPSSVQLAPTAEGDVDTFVARGYVQTRARAIDGGKANANGFRFRNGSMAALAESFRGQGFLTGHNWGDVRARGGTIVEARIDDEVDGDLAILFTIRVQATWAKEGLANGTIDRFSIGASAGQGEIMCTLHDVPVWSTEECFCWPGATYTLEREGKTIEVVAEWEYEDPIGEELSAVNVPAVDGTGIVDAEDETVAQLGSAPHLRMLAALCGRQHPRHFGAARASSSAPVAPAPGVDLAAVALALGLAADASAAAVAARAAELAGGAAASDAEHVDMAIARLQAEREFGGEAIQRLHETFATSGRAAFDRDVELVRAASYPRQTPLVGQPRARLQSDAAPALTDPAAVAALGAVGGDRARDEIWALMLENPAAPTFLRACQLTPDDVRKHGPRGIAIVHNLEQLVADTIKRGG